MKGDHTRNILLKFYQSLGGDVVWRKKLTTDDGQEYFLSFFFRLPWQPEFCMEFISLNNNERGPPKKHPYDDGPITIAYLEHFVLRWAKMAEKKMWSRLLSNLLFEGHRKYKLQIKFINIQTQLLCINCMIIY